LLSRRRTPIPDGVIGARTTRSAAHDWKDDALAALRALTVVELALGAGSVVGVAAGAVIGGAIRGDAGGIPMGHETRVFSDDAIGSRTTRSAALGCSNNVLARGARSPSSCRLKRAGAVTGRAAERSRCAVASANSAGSRNPRVFRRRDRRTWIPNDVIDARTTRSAARDREDDALAALLALAVVELARRSRRGGWRSGSTGVMMPAEFGLAVSMAHADSR